MKKVFTLAAFALLGLSAMAETSFSYYAGGEMTSWGGAASTDAAGQLVPMSFYINLSPAQSPQLKGCKVTRIEMINQYAGNLNDMTAWTSTPQTTLGEPFQQPDGQVVSVTVEDGKMIGTFETPVEIPAPGLSVGYTFTPKSTSGSYLEYGYKQSNVPNSFFRTWTNASQPVAAVANFNNGVLPITVYLEEGEGGGDVPTTPTFEQTGTFSYWHGEDLTGWGGGSNNGTFDAFIMIDTQNNPDLLNKKVIGITLTNSQVNATGNIRAWASQSQVATDGPFANLQQISTLPVTIDGSLITGMFTEPIKITNPQTWFGFTMSGPVSGSFPIDGWCPNGNIPNSMFRIWQNNIVTNANSWTWPIVLLLGEEVTTGVDEIATENAAPTYYDLMGREVSAPTHGIYIKKEGKKASKVIL